jgi:hypothetical protein
MSSTKEFQEKFRQWSDLFASRSMADTVRFVKHSDMSFAQFGSLAAVHVHQCGVTDIAGRLGVTSAAASQLVEKLVQAAMIDAPKTSTTAAPKTDAHPRAARKRHAGPHGLDRHAGRKPSPEQRAAAISTLDVLITAVQTLPVPEAAPVE